MRHKSLGFYRGVVGKGIRISLILVKAIRDGGEVFSNKKKLKNYKLRLNKFWVIGEEV